MPEEHSPPADAPAEAALRRQKLAELIDRWFVDHFHDSPIAAVTEHFNQATRARDDLKRRLREEI